MLLSIVPPFEDLAVLLLISFLALLGVAYDFYRKHVKKKSEKVHPPYYYPHSEVYDDEQPTDLYE